MEGGERGRGGDEEEKGGGRRERGRVEGGEGEREIEIEGDIERGEEGREGRDGKGKKGEEGVGRGITPTYGVH